MITLMKSIFKIILWVSHQRPNLRCMGMIYYLRFNFAKSLWRSSQNQLSDTWWMIGFVWWLQSLMKLKQADHEPIYFKFRNWMSINLLLIWNFNIFWALMFSITRSLRGLYAANNNIQKFDAIQWATLWISFEKMN